MWNERLTRSSDPFLGLVRHLHIRVVPLLLRASGVT